MKEYSKICTGCKTEKDATCFSKASRERDGLQHRCKQCNKDMSARYRQENPVKERERHKRYLEENREKRRQWEKEYNARNPERIREKAKRSYWKNHTKNIERNRKHCELNREKRKNNSAIWR